MPKKNKYKGRNQNNKLDYQGRQVTRVQGRAKVDFAADTKIGGFKVQEYPFQQGSSGPFGSRINALMDNFAYWRLKSFKVTAINSGTTSNLCLFAMGWIPLPPVNFTAATGMANMADFPVVHFWSPTFITPQVMHVRQKDTNREVNWFNTNNNSQEGFFCAGVLTYAALNGNTLNANYHEDIIEFDLEFKDPIDPALNPFRRRNVRTESIPSSPSLITNSSPSLEIISKDFDDEKEDMKKVISKLTRAPVGK